MNAVSIWKDLIRKIHCNRWAGIGKVQVAGNTNTDVQPWPDVKFSVHSEQNRSQELERTQQVAPSEKMLHRASNLSR